MIFLKYGRSCKAYLSANKDLYDGSIIAYCDAIYSQRLRFAVYFIRCPAPTMFRVGKWIDNGPIESFFEHFKTECYDLKQYKTFEELVSCIDAYSYFYIFNVFKSETKAFPLLK